jgi:DNA modification methylase
VYTENPMDKRIHLEIPAYQTQLGAAHCGDSLRLLEQLEDSSVNLFITSPPFALQREKEYGNKNQDDYLEWLTQFARLVHRKLRDDGSFVLDLGGAYQKGLPVRSLYNFRVLLKFCDELGFHLAEDFYWFNPAKLPSPIEWVNKRKIRVKDAVNTIWWFSKTPMPKADVSKVLVEYSDRMKKLLENPEKYYTAKKRPSGHDIGTAFGKDNGGAIPPNLLQIPNTEANGQYLTYCKATGTKGHPARFPAKLPEFFIQMLTDPGDLVVDIFAGSNTTGSVAENLARRWLAFELEPGYVANSVFRFLEKNLKPETVQGFYQQILAGESLDLRLHVQQQRLFELAERAVLAADD